MPAVSYRAGTWSDFKDSMLARLSSSDYPALARLKTRDDDDFTVAFLDATAMVLDVLTFYQERLVNESYLRTATQLRSLTELSRLISYTPAPAVSASVYLAFTLKTAPGLAPDPSALAITIPQGTQVQSVPAQGQTPQTFETSADVQAKPDWNALPVMVSLLWAPNRGDTSLYLDGTATNLQPGDAILVVGDERKNSFNSKTGWDIWDIRLVLKVKPDKQNDRTYVTWNEGLGGADGVPAQKNPRFFVFRQRASLFGYNAIDPNLLDTSRTSIVNELNVALRATVTIGGTVTAGDTISLTVTLPATGASTNISYVVVGGDSLQSIATALSNQVNASAALQGSGIAATVDGTAVILTSLPSPSPEPFLSAAGSGSETVDINFESLDYSWKGFQLSGVIDLDSAYSKIVQGGWAALVLPEDYNPNRSLSGFVSLYQVGSILSASRTDFGLSAKISRIVSDTPNDLGEYDLRKTLALVQSEELTVAPQPLTYPLYGAVLDLVDCRPDLNNVTMVALFGKRQKVAVNPGVTNLVFSPNDNSTPEPLKPGDVLTVADTTNLPLNSLSAPYDWANYATALTFDVQDAAGRAGTVSASPNQFTLVPGSSSDPGISEYALVSKVTIATNQDGSNPHTQLQLANPLVNCYDRSATTVNANVGLATHGQSVSEILGSGSASTPNQTFTLKQSPLTYVQSSTVPNGRKSTLQVQVNSVAWNGLPSLYNQSPSAQVFSAMNQADGTTDVIFGDGVEGALLPTGQNNLRANYRIGSGSQGNVAAGKLSTLMDRPLGVSGVVNPEDASGGQDAESPDDIRSNAPQTVLTLGRAVSIADYQNFAGTYAGITKAYAVWISVGPGLGVYLTVAGVNGTAVSSTTISSLVSALRNFGNPLIPITVVSYANTTFTFSASIQYDPSYDQTTVQGQALEAVQNGFSFAARSFGQPVSIDEIAAVIQNVPGVTAVNVTGLRTLTTSPGNTEPGLAQSLTLGRFRILPFWTFFIRRFATISSSTQRLCASLPVANSQSQPSPAEILTLDPKFNAGTSFSVMS